MPDDLIREARERWDAADAAERDNAAEALEDLRMYAGGGRQWDANLRMAREKEGRPCLEINRLPTFIHQVTGNIRMNPPAVKVRAAGGKATSQMAETLTGLIRNIEAQSDADAVYINAAESAAICGQGYFRVTTEYSENDGWEQDIRIKAIPSPFAVLFDPAAQHHTRMDAEYCFVQYWLPKLTFKEKFPDASDSGWNGDSAGEWSGWARAEDVRLCEYWRKVPITRRLLLLQDGATVDMTGKPDAAIADVVQMGGGLVRERKVAGCRVEMRLLNAVEELADPTIWAGHYLPIIPVFGEEVHVGDEVVRRGLVRSARDPQRLFNIHRSALAEAVAMATKAKWLATPNMIRGFEPAWKTANTNNMAYLPYNPDAGQVPQRIAPDMPGQGLLQEIGMAAQDLEATTGVWRDMLGKESNAQSGKAILARQREGDVGSFLYADNLARAVAHCGRILVDLMPQIYDSARVVRILGEDGSEEFVQINQEIIDPATGQTVIVNDISVGKYDVVASTGPSYGTRREEMRESMAAFFQAAPMAAQVAGDLFAEAMDWPGAEGIAKRMRKVLPPGLADPEPGEPPPQPAPPGADVLLAQAEMMKAQAAMAKVQAQSQNDQAELQIRGMELKIEMRRLEIEQATAGVTARTKMADTQIKGLSAQAAARTAQQKVALDGVRIQVDAASVAADQRHRRTMGSLDNAHRNADREHGAMERARDRLADQQQYDRQQAAAMRQMAVKDRQQDTRDDAD